MTSRPDGRVWPIAVLIGCALAAQAAWRTGWSGPTASETAWLWDAGPIARGYELWLRATPWPASVRLPQWLALALIPCGAAALVRQAQSDRWRKSLWIGLVATAAVVLGGDGRVGSGSFWLVAITWAGALLASTPISAGLDRVLRSDRVARGAGVVICGALAAALLSLPPAEPLRLRPALDALRLAQGDLAELLPGPGLTAGALRWGAAGGGWRVVEAPGAGWVGELAVAALRPSPPQRAGRLEQLADRTLVRYGVVRGTPSVRWSLYRPLALSFAAGAPRPDIAIVAVDTLRADRLPLYGYARDTAPGITRWSRSAMIFERAFATASETIPSFASLMTGRLPAGHGVRANTDFMLPGNWTLARVLQRAGYDTAAFVSSSVLQRGKRGLDDGFALYDDTLDHAEPLRPETRSRLAPALASRVEAWLATRRADGPPWLLWVHAIDPHAPYAPLPAYQGRFRSALEQAIPRSVIPRHVFDGSLDLAHYTDAYDAEIAQCDAALAPLLERLTAESGPRGRIVIFTADHGEGFGEHGHYFKHGESLHVEELWVPLIWWQTGGGVERVAEPVSLVDVVPTLYRRLGVEADLPLDGLPLEQRASARTPVVAGFRPGEHAVISGGIKLQRDARQLPPRQLAYDLARDPREAQPIDPTPALSAVLDRYEAADPIAADASRAFEQERWERQNQDDLEALRSLGYVGPGTR